MRTAGRTHVLGLAIASIALIAAADVRATAQRTFVASTGVDNSACSLAAPCRSFGAAIAQTNDRGEVIVLDSAGYGKVTIAKSVTITAPSGVYAGITVLTAEDGVTVNAPGAVVVLRGLTINGVGGNSGIRFIQGAELRVERCDISSMMSAAIDAALDGGATVYISDSSAVQSQKGISLHGAGHASLARVRANGNSFSGIDVIGVLDVALRDVELERNSSGVVIGGGTTGLTATLSRGLIDEHCGGAISASSSTATVSVLVSDTGISRNGCGSGNAVRSTAGGSGVTRLSLVRTGFVGNGGALSTLGGGAVAYIDNDLFTANAVTGFSIDAAGGPIYTRLNNTVQGTSISANVLPYSPR